MKKFLVLMCFLLAITACESDNGKEEVKGQVNEVLLLKVGYMSNNFEGGTELSFTKLSTDFNLVPEYVSPGDFGSIKMIYSDIDEVLFDGTIHWMGLGKRTFPEELQTADSFLITETEDYVYPPNGIHNVFNPGGEAFDYDVVWGAIQNVKKVREYLVDNSNAEVKLFLYTPSVGDGNPYDWYWVVFVKK
ncbi:hypothetical protein [Myroides indicus]|uniref:Heme-binding HmuY-like protein n=1 Tax=Myroides indicus TaxID=1323422 RepID=A0A4R7ESW1_9FLAO|nr:hypothetical protein [Myroides indicus]TDS55298.1 hypothetical protein C8P70_12218 [Myroides indicus]